MNMTWLTTVINTVDNEEQYEGNIGAIRIRRKISIAGCLLAAEQLNQTDGKFIGI